MLQIVVVVFATLAAIGCAGDGQQGGASCALDLEAVYTSTVVPNGRPQVGTLEGLLGPCTTRADERWEASCAGDVATFACPEGHGFTWTVLDASSAGYTVRIEDVATHATLVTSLVEGDTTTPTEGGK